MIRIHNSLTRQKEPLRPITPGHVRMYVRGITVYDYLHIGHARMLLVFDMALDGARLHLRGVEWRCDVLSVEVRWLWSSFWQVPGRPACGCASCRGCGEARSAGFRALEVRQIGDPSWPSPWGPGRPRWHIECSAMSTALLGNHFDLHGGGLDLKFPHHENEIAQSCAATHEHFANIWMHNGFVNVGSEKMSKSLGNFFTLCEVLRKLRDPEVLRYILSVEPLPQPNRLLIRTA